MSNVGAAVVALLEAKLNVGKALDILITLVVLSGEMFVDRAGASKDLADKSNSPVCGVFDANENDAALGVFSGNDSCAAVACEVRIAGTASPAPALGAAGIVKLKMFCASPSGLEFEFFCDKAEI